MSEPKLKQHTTDDFGHFLKSWIQNPFAIGAVAPSGKPLARRWPRGYTRGARVIELGAGTGTLTAGDSRQTACGPRICSSSSRTRNS